MSNQEITPEQMRDEVLAALDVITRDILGYAWSVDAHMRLKVRLLRLIVAPWMADVSDLHAEVTTIDGDSYEIFPLSNASP